MALKADFEGAKVRPSPNFGERKGDRPVDMLVLHYTGMESGGAAEDWLCNIESEVSCHYLVHENGRIVQMVPEAARAWHAGASQWQGEGDLNSRSIGIEIVNKGHAAGDPLGLCPPFPIMQMDAVIELSRDIVQRWSIPAQRVLAHSDIAPGRKIDPGEVFDWALLAQNGVGHWVEPAPIAGGRFFALGESGQPVEALQAMFAMYGYPILVHGEFDVQMKNVVEAFQRHFRPAKVDGVVDISTIETLRALIASQPSAT